MKVVHVLKELQVGGAESVSVSLCNWLSDQGHEVWLVSRSGRLGTRLRPGVHWVQTPPGGWSSDLRTLWTTVRRVRPDVIHAHQRREALLALLVGRRHGAAVAEHAHTVLPSRRLASLSFRSDRIFAVGKAVEHMVVDTFGRDPHRVIVVGNAPAATAPGRPSRGRTESGRLRLAGVGRLSEQKDPLRFVRVVAEMAAKVKVSADWYGAGELRDEASALADSLGVAIEFRGVSDDIAGVLDDHDALLVTSKWEGRPLVILEAMARKRPVIGLDIAGVHELLSDSRGVLIDPSVDDEAFARIALAALADENSVTRTVDLAYRFTLEHASEKAVFGPVLAHYRELVNP